jgi:hypothetical protein
MAALIALQLRLAWRGIPLSLRIGGILLLILGVHAVISKRPDSGGLSGAGVAFMAVFMLGLAAVSAGSEPLTWQVPIPRSVRAWARIILLVVGGSVHTALVLGLYRLLGVPPAEPWGLLGANLWFCWVSVGLLLFLAGDLTRARPPLLQAIAILLCFAPGTLLWIFHLADGLHPGFLIGEITAVVALCWLNLAVNRDFELHARLTMPKDEPDIPTRPFPRSVDPPAAPALRSAPLSRRLLDRTPNVTPVLFSSLFPHVWVWLLAGIWLLVSFLPVTVLHAIFAILVLPLFFQGVLSHWQAFQATPLSRRSVYLRLLAPILGFWALILIVQGTTLWLSPPPTILRIERLNVLTGDGTHESRDRVAFDLPSARRDPEAAISPPLLPSSWDQGLPQPPAQAAALMSEAFRVAHGLQVSASEILALHPPGDLIGGRDPAQADWLRDVERRWSTAVRWRHTEWKLLIGLAGLVLSLLSLVSTLRGRWPWWIVLPLPLLTGTLPLLLILSPPRWIQAPWLTPVAWSNGIIYDRPGTLIAALTALVALLLYRHLRVFSSGEIWSSRRRT